MIRLTTDKLLAATFKHHRVAVAEQIAEAVEAMPYEVCGHNDRASCAKCATRLAVLAVARVVRETGGLKP